MGRHTDYTDELAEDICELLAEGQSLRSICADDAMPNRRTVMRWLDANPDFATKYARAREEGFDQRAEKIEVDIEAEEDVARARLKLDYAKWYLAKLAPKRYGEKLDLGVSGPNGGPIETAVTFNLNPVKGRKPEGGE